MNNFKLKFLLIYLAKNQNQGFTLLELLIVIFILGILAAIALPSFLRMADRAREVEAIAKINYLNKNQQSYYGENSIFSRSIDSSETTNYIYLVVILNRGQIAVHVAMPKNERLPYYGGGVYFKQGSMVTCGAWPAKTVDEAIATYYARCP